RMPHITGIFPPERAEPGLDGVARCNTGKTHPISFGESIPMWPVFFGLVLRRADGGGPRSHQQALYAKRLPNHPFDPLFAGKRLVGSLRRDDPEIFEGRTLWLCDRRFRLVRILGSCIPGVRKEKSYGERRRVQSTSRDCHSSSVFLSISAQGRA